MTYPRISAKDAQAVRDKIDAALTSGSTRVDVEARGFLELESTYVKYGDSGVTVDCDALYEAALSAQKDLITSGGAAAYKKTGDEELPFYVEELMARIDWCYSRFFYRNVSQPYFTILCSSETKKFDPSF